MGGLGLTQDQKSAVDSLLASADPNFVPGSGQIVVVYVNPASCVQKFIFEYPIPSGGVPEFGEGVPAVVSLALIPYVFLRKRLRTS